MIENIVGKLLLSPISLIYGVAVGARNVLYDSGLLKSTSFSVPVIAVGNLSIGGAGKSPHVEYLIKLLSPYVNVATLSRGYKRKTKGFRIVSAQDDALTVGDEPLVFKRKFDADIVVAVGESRAIAIPEMIARYPDIQVVLLDDAFQHRSVKPGLNILLTTFDEPFTKDYLMPSGRLREWRSSYSRADIIIVTKCPETLDPEAKQKLIESIYPQGHQHIFFSKYEYGHPYSLYDGNNRIAVDKSLDVILLSAIANTKYLMKHLRKLAGSIYHLDYEDHHQFTTLDMEHLQKVYSKRETKKKIVITTEKDAIRLEPHMDYLHKMNIPIFVLPLRVVFHDHEGSSFDELVRSYLLNVKV